MIKLFSYCGYNCTNCPIYKVTEKNNMDELKNLKIKLEKETGSKISIQDLKCKGCKSKNIYKYCRECRVRECAIKKGVECCAICDYENCSLIEKINKYNKNIFSILDKIKSDM